MLVVVASHYDEAARSLVDRWANQEARLLTCEDLSVVGWRYCVSGKDEVSSSLLDSTAVVDGQVVGVEEISGVLTCLPCVFEQELLHIVPNMSWCSTQFQHYIPGTDYRVHVVDTEVFACEVISDVDDYRYAAQDAAPAELRSCCLPSDIEARCWILAKALHLPVAGIDLRCTPSGDWYYFEVNPAPGFTYYQQATGQPISKAIAQLLVRGTCAQLTPCLSLVN